MDAASSTRLRRRYQTLEPPTDAIRALQARLQGLALRNGSRQCDLVVARFVADWHPAALFGDRLGEHWLDCRGSRLPKLLR